MKKTGLFLLVLFLSCNFAWSQDTLYIYKAGIVVVKKAVTDVDSITFSKNTTLPVAESVTDVDGTLYHTVKIGTQTWMVENLKTTKYRNGDAIGTTSYLNMTLTYETAPKYQWAFDGLESNVADFGRLYTWYVVNDPRNIAPIGWHVATDAEWTTLENYLTANGYNYDKTTTGNKISKALCATRFWNYCSTVGTPGNNLLQNNASGLGLVPAGYRGHDGYFYLIGNGTDIWTASEYSTDYAYFRGCGYNVTGLGLGSTNSNKRYGFAVRCVKDVPTVPALKTVAATYVTDSSAVVTAQISSNGGSAITARGFCWSTKANPTIADNKISSTDSLNLSSQLTGLKGDSTYYVRAYATNSLGTGYSDQLSFKTYSKGSTLVIDADGNSYLTVKIGTQTWMAENLKVTHYRNGDAIANVTDNNSWTYLSTGAYCWYNNDIANKSVYGAMYNGYTISDSRNIAPAGWHVATLEEWTTLMTYLGGETLAGAKLKEAGTTHWLTPNTGATNISGFTALPGGLRHKDSGDFFNMGYNAFFWNNTQTDSYSTKQSVLYNDRTNYGLSVCSNNYGISVRCIKD